LLNSAFAMAILDLISQVHLPSSVNKLPKYLKLFTVMRYMTLQIIWTKQVLEAEEKYLRRLEIDRDSGQGPT
jgi:hypothetical protein